MGWVGIIPTVILLDHRQVYFCVLLCLHYEDVLPLGKMEGGAGEGEGWALTRWSDIDMKIWEGMGRQMVACGSIYVHRGVMERDFCIYPWRRLRLRLRPQSSILDP